MSKLDERYDYFCKEISDINEHLPLLSKCASKCESILETGVRGGVSSWALAHGLVNNGKTEKYLFLNDKIVCNVDELIEATKDLGIVVEYEWKNNLELNLEREFDMLFIDTWHVYGQLKRELKAFSKKIRKYIVMHDTTVDDFVGETLRNGWNPSQQSAESGIPEDEITRGVWPAIEEFLEENPEWTILGRFTNNNGLTVLKRSN